MKLDLLKRRIRPAGHISIAIAIVAAAASYSTASFALGNAEQRAACTSDVMRLCTTSLASESALVACITKKRSQFSKRCQATLPPL
jgi:hypothetical protein